MTNLQSDILKLALPTPFAVGDVNVYIIKGDALTLIDAGVKTEEAQASLERQLADHGLSPSDIEQVVLTHHHPDHIGMLDLFSADVLVFAHQYAKPWIEKDETFIASYDRFYEQLFVEFGLHGDFPRLLKGMKAPLRYAGTHALNGELKEGDAVPGLPGWTVIETHGHAQSHLAFYREKDGVLIAGDHLLAHISSNPLLEPPLVDGKERPKPQLQYNESLKKMLDVDISTAFTGHGADVKDAHSLVERRLKRQHDRAFQLVELLRGRRLSTFEITKMLFPKVFEQQLGLTLSETTAQLDYLSSLGAIEKSPDEKGVLYFSSPKETVKA